jgi:hypothetical protein
MGAKGRAWMTNQFSWAHVADEMDQAYRWIINGGSTPANVRFD